MEEKFVTYAAAKVMLANTTYERAGGRAALRAVGRRGSLAQLHARRELYRVCTENGGSVIYAEAERTEYLWPAIGGGAAVIAAAGAYLLFRRKKKRAAPAESGEQAE